MSFPDAASRRAITAATTLAVASALALCGSAAASAATEATPAAAASRPVQSIYGKVSVPTDPKRIVALDFPEATALADLGIKPVGVDNYIPAFPSYTKFFKDIPVVTNSESIPEVEKVAALKPDLIVGDVPVGEYAKYKSVYEQLAQIAPTVMLEWTEAAGNWQADAAGTAAAVGKSAQLDRLRASFLAQAKQIKQTYAHTLATHTVDLVSANDASDWDLYGPTSSHGKVLAAAGARFGAAKQQKAGYVQYSSEKYSLLQNTGIIIVQAAGGAQAKPVTSNPLFAALPAATDHDVFTTPYFFPSSYRIADALLDDFASALKQVK